MLVFIVLLAATVIPPLDDEAAMTRGNKTLEYGSKLLGNLLERALDRLILDLV